MELIKILSYQTKPKIYIAFAENSNQLMWLFTVKKVHYHDKLSIYKQT